MIRGIYTAVSGLITQEAKQDSISNNLANVNTVGYKRDNIISKKFEDVLLQNFDKVVDGKNTRNILGTLSLGSRIDETYVDYEQGDIEATTKDTDFAISGNGFFVVAKGDGTNDQNYYTRDGHFYLDREGYLLNDNGYKLMGTTNNGTIEPINLMVNGKVAKIKCDESGNISLNDVPTYKLNIADFEDYSNLKKMGENLYSGENPITARKCKISQNALEKSNVNVMNEMADMMMTMRSFESNQKIVQSLDETLGKAVNEVGKV